MLGTVKHTGCSHVGQCQIRNLDEVVGLHTRNLDEVVGLHTGNCKCLICMNTFAFVSDVNDLWLTTISEDSSQ